MQTVVCQFPLHIESPPSFEPKQMASRLSDETDEALLKLQEEEEDEDVEALLKLQEEEEDEDVEVKDQDHEEVVGVGVVLQSVGQVPSIGS